MDKTFTTLRAVSVIPEESCFCLPEWKGSPNPGRSSRGKPARGLPALLLHPRGRGMIFCNQSCNAEMIAHFLPLHVQMGCVCCKLTGLLKVVCEKRRETKTLLFCSSCSQFYLIAACKDQEIFKLIASGVTDLLKLENKTKIQQKYF